MVTVALDEELDASGVDPSDESEEDTRGATGKPADAVVAGTDWTAETLLNQLRRGNIELNPSFQRRDAWTVERKSRFIESLIVGIPIPQVVLAERRERRGSYIVIDGKQRLLALAQFAGYAKDSMRNGFALRGATLNAELNGTTYQMMQEDPSLDGILGSFENATIRTVVIKNWPSEEYLHLVFHRLNTGSVPLSPQELRQALYPGPFTEFVDRYAFDSESIRSALGITGKDFRMRDAELLVRTYAFGVRLEEYGGNLKRFLDETCEELNSQWPEQGEELMLYAEEIDKAIRACQSVFLDHAFRRVQRDSEPESRFNRAIYDTQMLFMTDPDVRAQVVSSGEEVRQAYVDLARARAFSDASGSTTKSISSTFTRFSLWANALRAVLGPVVPEVEMSPSNRIRVVQG